MRRSRIFRRRIFANFFPFSAGFHVSKIRLNIVAVRKLTKKRASRLANNISAT
jgi:hypothetical protein